MSGRAGPVMERSVLGLIHTYNALPQRVVSSKTVPAFQSAVQNGLKRHCQSGIPTWLDLLRTGARSVNVRTFQELV